MKRLISVCQKYEIFIRLIILAVFFITLFLPYYYETADSYSADGILLPVHGYSISLSSQLNYTYYTFFLIVLFFVILFGLIFSLFGKKLWVFQAISNITEILFIGFFFSVLYELISIQPLWNNKYIPHVSFYIWLLLFILDCIYLFMALQKAFPFKKNTNSDEDKNS